MSHVFPRIDITRVRYNCATHFPLHMSIERRIQDDDSSSSSNMCPKYSASMDDDLSMQRFKATEADVRKYIREWKRANPDKEDPTENCVLPNGQCFSEFALYMNKNDYDTDPNRLSHELATTMDSISESLMERVVRKVRGLP